MCAPPQFSTFPFYLVSDLYEPMSDIISRAVCAYFLPRFFEMLYISSPQKGVLLYHFVSKCYFLLCKVNLSTAVCERFE